MRGLMSEVYVAVILGFACLGIYWSFSRSRQILTRWAAAHGYSLLTSERRYLRRGPFLWFTSKNQTVFYVTVRDGERVRSGWVRCGGWWLGLFSERAEVRWDE